MRISDLDIHGRPKIFVCEKCGFESTSRGALVRHKRAHEHRQYDKWEKL